MLSAEEKVNLKMEDKSGLLSSVFLFNPNTTGQLQTNNLLVCDGLNSSKDDKTGITELMKENSSDRSIPVQANSQFSSIPVQANSQYSSIPVQGNSQYSSTPVQANRSDNLPVQANSANSSIPLQDNSGNNNQQQPNTNKRKREPKQISEIPETFRCQICNKEFLSKAGAKFHEKNHHTDAKLFCLVCKKSFKFHYDLDRHMKTHTGQRPYECANCDKAFVCKSSLTQHIRLKHLIGKVYGCADCSKSFCTEADLKRHVAVHLDNKPFKCDKCQKTFTCKSSLNVHRRNHGEKKFACSYCNMHFHVPTDLSRHVTVHTGERPWRCAVCDKGYSCKSTLSVHIKQVHTDNPTPEMYLRSADGKTYKKNKRPAKDSLLDTDLASDDDDDDDDESDDECDGVEDGKEMSLATDDDDGDDDDGDSDFESEEDLLNELKSNHKRKSGSSAKSLDSSERLQESLMSERTVNPYTVIDKLNKETRQEVVMPVALFKSNKRGRKAKFVRKLEISDGPMLLYKS